LIDITQGVGFGGSAEGRMIADGDIIGKRLTIRQTIGRPVVKRGME
jgi:hypothetical protein